MEEGADSQVRPFPWLPVLFVAECGALPCRSTATIAVGKIRSSWDVRLQQRAERAAVLAAQKAVDDLIKTTKRVSLQPIRDAALIARALSPTHLVDLFVGREGGKRSQRTKEERRRHQGSAIPSGAHLRASHPNRDTCPHEVAIRGPTPLSEPSSSTPLVILVVIPSC